MQEVLIIGTGGIGKRHIRGFLKTGRANVSVCEPAEERRESVLQEYPLSAGYTDIESAPLHKFDLAVIATPANMHVPLAQKLTEANLPFLMEKPLAVSMEGVEQLIKDVNSRNLCVRVGYIRRCTPWIQALKNQVENGKIGDVKMAYLNASQDFRKIRPDYQETYYAKRDMGGGAIMDCGSHFVDVLIWTLGRIEEVSAMHDRLVFEGVECEDCALINFRFSSGAMAQLAINQFQKPNISTIEMIGLEGNLHLLDTKGDIMFASDDSGNWETTSFVPEEKTPLQIHEEKFALQAEQFMDVVAGTNTEDELATLEDAAHNLEVCLKALESRPSRRIRQVDQ